MENGDPSKPMILFLHGFPEFWYSWRHQITEFSKDFYTVALDIRGFGESDLPLSINSMRMDAIVVELKSLMDYLSML